ncbi:MAG TPA: hypothetical protein VI341_04950 [Actinomycetota bacterium]
MIILAVGVPVLTGPADGWNFWPLVGIPLAMVIAVRWWHLEVTAQVMITAILVGLVSADAIAAWGVLPVVLGVTCLTVIGSIPARQGRRNEPPTV